MASSLPPTPSDNQRAGSIRSVASNSSIASGVSLTRRSRTRTRAKTLTGGSPGAAEGRARVDALAIAGDQSFLDIGFHDEPMPDGDDPALPFTSSARLETRVPPLRSPRSPQRQEKSRTDPIPDVHQNTALPAYSDFSSGFSQDVRGH